MPLLAGTSESTIRANIAKLVAEGYALEQAVAIAHQQAEDAPPEASESGEYVKVSVKIPLRFSPGA